MRILGEIGLAHLERGEPREAVRSLELALSLSRREQTDASAERADILVGLGRANLALAKPAAACPLLAEATTFWRALQPGHPDAKAAAQWLTHCNEIAPTPVS